MGRGFGVGDLDGLTSRLRRAGEDLDDAAARIAGLGVGRHGILDPTTARAVHVLWSGWSGSLAGQAARCARLAGAVAEVSLRYRAADDAIAGCRALADASGFTAVAETCAVGAWVDLTEGPLMADPGEVLAGMVATCHHLPIDVGHVAHTIAACPATVDWWGAAADAAHAAIRDLSRDVAATATAIDALHDVFAAYGDTVWPRAGLTLPALAILPGGDPGGDLAEQARDADSTLRAGLAAWSAPRHGDTATVGVELPDHRRPGDSQRRVTVLTAASIGRGEPPAHAGSLTVARRSPIDTYRVVPGDTLWAIARRTLADARRWRDIFALNEGRRQRDGRTLTDPRLILPGWRLQLPHTDTRPGPTAVARPGRAAGNPPIAAPTTSRPTPASVTPNTTPTVTPPRGAAAHPAQGHGSVWPMVDLGLGAALGAGVGWVAGRRRPRPGMAARDVGRPTTPTPAESHPPVNRVGPGEHPPTAPAASSPSVPTPRGDITPRAIPAPSSLTDTMLRWPGAWPPVGTGLVGPGAAAAARTILLDALNAHPPLGAARAGTVITTSTAMTLLLPEDPIFGDSVTRLTIVDHVTAALDLIDQEILTRSRTTHDATTPADDSDPAGNGPSPPLLVIVEPPPPADRVRLAAILLQGTALGIDAVILGPWPSGDTITVGHNGHSTPAGDSRGSARQLPITDIDTTRTLLQSPTSARPRDANNPPHPTAPDPLAPNPPISSSPLLTADAGSMDGPLATCTAPPRREVPNPVDSAPEHPATGQLTGRSHTSRRRVDVRVLGATPHLTDPPAATAAAPPWRPQARELLAYLICHPRGVAEHILFEDVLGDVPGSKVRPRLNTYVYNLHQQLRTAGGPGTYITHAPHGHVMIDPDRVDSDLWRLHRHLHTAATATDTDTRIIELHAAVAAYTGPLAAGHDYYWIPPIREATRRQVVDAHLNLAELLTDTDPDAAIIVIEQAISHDPYNETLYQHAMRLHAARHALPAVAVLRNRLVRELADIGTTPTPDTIRLAHDLLANTPDNR